MVLLRWAPPDLVTPITINVGVTEASVTLTAGQDYILQMPASVKTGRLRIVGGRNVVLIGGHISLNNKATLGQAIQAVSVTGTLHIEGLLIDRSSGASLDHDGIQLGSSTTTNNIVQVQNCRIIGLTGTAAGTHADVIQQIDGTELRVHRLTATSNYQGLFVRDSSSDVLGKVVLEDVDIAMIEATDVSENLFMYSGATPGPFTTIYEYTNVYLDMPGTRTVLRSGITPNDLDAAPRTASQTGTTITWPGLTNITGNVQDAVPASPMVASGTPGLSYVSPGYRSTAVEHPLAGAITATSATAATRLVLAHPLAGAVTATSVTAATTIRLDHPLAATASGASATAGALAALAGAALTGAVTGASATAASALVMDRPLAGAVAGTSATAVSTLTLTHPLAGAVTATSATAATRVTITPALAGAAAGTSATAATRIVITPALSGASVATSATAATGLTLDRPLSGTATGTSATAVTAITVGHVLSGAVAGTSATAGAFTALGTTLAGAAAGTSTTAGTRLVLTHPLSGAVAGTSAATGAFPGSAAALAGAAAGTSATAATRITIDQPLAASASGTSILSAPRLVLTHPLDGSALGSSVVAAGGVRIAHALIGGVAGSSLTGADLLFTILARRTFLAIRPTTGTLVAARSPRRFDGSGPS